MVPYSLQPTQNWILQITTVIDDVVGYADDNNGPCPSTEPLQQSQRHAPLKDSNQEASAMRVPYPLKNKSIPILISPPYAALFAWAPAGGPPAMGKVFCRQPQEI